MQSTQTPGSVHQRRGWRHTALLVITLMLAGRAMTLAFIGSAGSGLAGDPPAAWRMPLLGDAVIGLSALLVAWMIIRGHGLGAWVTVVLWNALGIWDALAAFVVHTSNPWPDFFMIEIFGPSMFFAAAAMHGAAIWLNGRPPSTGLRREAVVRT